MGKDQYIVSIAADVNWYIGCLGDVTQTALVLASTRYRVAVNTSVSVADGGLESSQVAGSLQMIRAKGHHTTGVCSGVGVFYVERITSIVDVQRTNPLS